ncbi:hypothetical protein GVN23_00850 [Sphingobium yanoikuyae]|nr:hypothetical protein [Sphingobium yanoikuyae]NBB37632.1 hypothetical protein [Sphingobium yanoikuyae]
MTSIASREPVIWWIFGEPFHAGPTIVCICGVIITRVIIGLQAKGKAQWTLDIAITALCLLVATLWVQAQNLELLAAGITGIGVGSLGAGVIGIAKSAAKSAVIDRFKAAFDAFMGTTPR